MPASEVAGEIAVEGFDPIFDVELARRALTEDIGRGDVTTEATIPADALASGCIVTRQSGVIAGLPMTALVFRLLDPQVDIETLVADGARVD
ncbi:MAG TPA: hypothetical protein VKQ36_04385, partial [Ktedonobacterales bacterium]|nr:hypothetical protein [Ktedonobacterales bacterium]